jgi:hypothetical protein
MLSNTPAPHGAGSTNTGQLGDDTYVGLQLLMKLAQAVLATEFIDPATRINDLLLATDLDCQVLTQSRTGREFVATTTGHFDIAIVGMNIGFHWASPVFRVGVSGGVGYREASCAASPLSSAISYPQKLWITLWKKFG